MAVTVTLYSMYKRLNSTKVPDINTPVIATLTGNFEVDCSIYNPVIILEKRAQAYQVSGNYLKITYDAFKSGYYWINDTVYTRNGRVKLYCSMDILATYRSAVLQSWQTITRSSKIPAGNRTVLDNSIQTVGKPLITRNQLTNPFSARGGMYVVGLLAREITYASGQSGDPDNWLDTIREENGTVVDESTAMFRRGAISYIGMDAAQAAIFFNWLLNLEGRDADYIPQQIVSCVYIPVDFNAYLGTILTEKITSTFVFYEGWDGNIGQILKGPPLVYNITHTQIHNVPDGVLDFPVYDNLNLAKYNYSNYSGSQVVRDCLNFRPYHICELLFGPFGTIQIPYEKCANVDTDVHDGSNVLRLKIDLCTGMASLMFNVEYTLLDDIIAHGGQLVRTVWTTTAQLCPTVPLTTITSDSHLAMLKTITNTAAGLVGGGLAMYNDRPGTMQVTETLVSAADQKALAAGVGMDLVDTYDVAVGGGLPFALGAAAVVKTAADFAIQAYANSIPQVSVSGSNGTYLDFVGNNYALQYTDYEFALLENAKLGTAITPYNTQLSDFMTESSIYIECSNPKILESFNIADPTEVTKSGVSPIVDTAICDFLANGIYLE